MHPRLQILLQYGDGMGIDLVRTVGEIVLKRDGQIHVLLVVLEIDRIVDRGIGNADLIEYYR